MIRSAPNSGEPSPDVGLGCGILWGQLWISDPVHRHALLPIDIHMKPYAVRSRRILAVVHRTVSLG